MKLHRFLFWLHLSAGATAGIVILIMSVTGLLLAYERQIVAWADGADRPTPHGSADAPLPIEALLSKIRETQHAFPSTLTVRPDPAAPVAAAFGRERTIYVNRYTGETLREESKSARAFFNTMTSWHRWLGANGENRAAARAVTGACNLGFLFLVPSGFYLWWPDKWSLRNFRAIAWFRGGLTSRARDWNWHNTIGFWSAVPLFLIVLSGVIMSYPWANDLLYRLTGSEAPPQGRRAGGPDATLPTDLNLDGLDKLWDRAQHQVSGWRSIGLRLPASPRAPVTFQIDQGDGGRPDQRSQLTLNRKTGEIVRWESFSGYNLGRRLRFWARFAHTGEAGGVPGQTIAAIASAGTSVLVWTGLALALRFRAWRVRKVAREQILA